MKQSRVFHEAFGEKLKDAIKNPENANKALRFDVKKHQLQVRDLPSVGCPCSSCKREQGGELVCKLLMTRRYQCCM